MSNYRFIVAFSLAALVATPLLAQQAPPGMGGPGAGGPGGPKAPPKQKTLKALQDRPTLAGANGTLYFQTNLGSFRSANGAGKMTFSFSGTVLVHTWDLDVKVKDADKAPKTYKVTLSGNIRKEYERHGREVFFGKGTITIEGVWRAIQWFGKDMKGQWTGHGSISVVGEFDKQGNTGLFWYDPAKKNYWPTSLMELSLPERKFQEQVEPQERKKG